MSGKTNKWIFGAVSSVLWITLLFFIFSDFGVENSPTDYLGKWQIDNGTYIHLSPAEDGLMPNGTLSISNFRAHLLLPVDVRVSIPSSFFWWDFWIRYNGRGGIYSIQGQHVLDLQCNVVLAIRKSASKSNLEHPFKRILTRQITFTGKR